MFRVRENISMSSFKKKNLISMSAQLVSDTKKLQSFIRRLSYLRVLSSKSLLLSSCVTFPTKSTVSLPYFYYILHLNKLLFLCNIYRKTSLSVLYFFNVCMYYRFLLPLNSYYLYVAYYRYLISYLFFFTASCFFNGLCDGVATLPTSIKKFTVLRSPHSDKKSREQFELRTHKRVFQFPSCFSRYYSYTCFIQNSLFLCTYVHTNTVHKDDSF